eukprot:CAMPEP_0117537658 /NCGR_PEP_ID=MMETSP0784-20121206/42081_1 /TAXON_ID=39447 /ORGANISM="" /LENGTH=174 /DNA_ID=CAMNT_0005334257 /DNA_START=62 /DNA_END=587 /DNA_ORIENTATION=-
MAPATAAWAHPSMKTGPCDLAQAAHVGYRLRALSVAFPVAAPRPHLLSGLRPDWPRELNTYCLDGMAAMCSANNGSSSSSCPCCCLCLDSSTRGVMGEAGKLIFAEGSTSTKVTSDSDGTFNAFLVGVATDLGLAKIGHDAGVVTGLGSARLVTSGEDATTGNGATSLDCCSSG